MSLSLSTLPNVVDTFDLRPGFPFETDFVRASEYEDVRSGISNARQMPRSHSRFSVEDQTRRFTLNFPYLNRDEALRLRDLYTKSGGGSELLDFLPPGQTANLIQHPEEFDFKSSTNTWLSGTASKETVWNLSHPASPVDSSKYAWKLVADSGNSGPASIHTSGETGQGFWAGYRGKPNVASMYIRHEGSADAATIVSLRIDSHALRTGSGFSRAHYVTFDYSSSAWSVRTPYPGGDAVGYVTSVGDSWFRIEVAYNTGDNVNSATASGFEATDTTESDRTKYRVYFYVGSWQGGSANYQAGKKVYFTGAMFEQGVSRASTYTNKNNRILVRFVPESLTINRRSGGSWEAQCQLEEALIHA